MTRNSLVLQSQEPLPQSGFSYPSPGSGNPHSQQCTNDFLLLDNWINTILLSTQPQEHAPLSTSLAQPGPTFRIPALSDTRHASQMAAFPSGCVCELLSHVRLCNPIDCSPQAPPSMGFSRQEHWSGLPFPPPKGTTGRKKVRSLSCVQLFATPWTVAYQAPPSTEFSRQENWSGLPFPSPMVKVGNLCPKKLKQTCQAS